MNGIRSAEKKGLLEWLAADKPDVLGLQETKVDALALPPNLRAPKGYHATWAFPKRKGYSGVALYHRKPALKVYDSLGLPEYDDEGRMIGIELEDLLIFSVYFPKGSGVLRDNSRVPYKLGFYDAFFAFAEKLKKKSKKGLVVMGDFNTAHQNLDLVHWKTNAKNSGFMAEERERLAHHLGRGYIDTFRHLYPTKEQYSWWSQRFNARARNMGWRIDYVWISGDLKPRLKDAFILDQINGSDHCPVGISFSN